MSKVMMIQGTMSNAGKSLIVAGLCRILKQDGYLVAPFKSQNMALNSFITKDGLEMGRAQVIQAEAAGIEPIVQMNPILLKPTNDTGSQVIVNGEVLTNMSAREYFAYKQNLIPTILEAYHFLEEKYDVIVIEGAGSPAEINLKQDDIVNMGMAKLVNAPVLLIGDIDRGGVFAQLLGTTLLLEEEERDRVKGLIINKFRGDQSILDPGVKMLEEKVNIPVIGVVPYMHLDIEDEDSLSERLSTIQQDQEHAIIDIAIIRFPRLSNFTDFQVLSAMEGVGIRYVTTPSELKQPDLIILPGTKNTMEDLMWMRQKGLEAAILKEADRKTLIFGICGGFQMLGESLSDPLGVEQGGSIRGMGLLPIRTVFQAKKTRSRVKGKIENNDSFYRPLSLANVSGYEIHMGNSHFTKTISSFSKITDLVSNEEKEEGAIMEHICGTYIHGVFDEMGVAMGLIQTIAEKKGISKEEIKGMDYQVFKESQYDLLAEELRKSLDMEKVYEILFNEE